MDHLELREMLGCWSLWEVNANGKFQVEKGSSLRYQGLNKGSKRYYTKLSWSDEEEALQYAAKNYPDLDVKSWEGTRTYNTWHLK